MGIKNEIQDHCLKVNREKIPLLIAVSKTKTEEDIIEAYNAGQRHFGENYAKELKGKSAALSEHCPDIRWHFIGTIQKKQLNQILKSNNLVEIQTIGSFAVLEMIHKRISSDLEVMLQINTSGEEGKGGFVELEEVMKSVQFIRDESKFLKFTGLMTIGPPTIQN